MIAELLVRPKYIFISIPLNQLDKPIFRIMCYFSSQPTKLDAHVMRAMDLNNSVDIHVQERYRLCSKWYRAVQMRPIEEQNLWTTTPIRNSSPSNRKVRIEHVRYQH